MLFFFWSVVSVIRIKLAFCAQKSFTCDHTKIDFTLGYEGDEKSLRLSTERVLFASHFFPLICFEVHYLPAWYLLSRLLYKKNFLFVFIQNIWKVTAFPLSQAEKQYSQLIICILPRPVFNKKGNRLHFLSTQTPKPDTWKKQSSWEFGFISACFISSVIILFT